MIVRELTDETTLADAHRFATSPARFFGHSWHAMHHVEPDRLAALQVEALRWRFAELRDRIPVLSTMASEQDVDQLFDADDVVPLLFQHSVYKSYPPALLTGNRFGHLTRWLDRLTAHDLIGLW